MIEQILEEKGYYIISKEDKERLDRLRTMDSVEGNFNILINAGPDYMNEVIKCIQTYQNDLLKKSIKGRKLDSIVYTDGGSDFADKLKSGLAQLIKRSTIGKVVNKKVNKKVDKRR